METPLIRRAKSVSLVLLGVSIALFISGYLLVPQDHRLSLGDSFHLSILRMNLDARIVFFSDQVSGPYSGGIIQLDGYPPLARKEGFDAPGIYYRYFQFEEAPDKPLWTLMVSLWFPVSLFAVLPVTHSLWVWSWRYLD